MSRDEEQAKYKLSRPGLAAPARYLDRSSQSTRPYVPRDGSRSAFPPIPHLSHKRCVTTCGGISSVRAIYDDRCRRSQSR
jgi:hypothetical protein